MDEVAKLKLPVPAWDVNRLNKAASAFTNMGRDKALMYMQSLKLEDYGDPLEVGMSRVHLTPVERQGAGHL